MLRSTNDDPEKCFTREGATYTIVKFTTTAFQKSFQEKFVCFSLGQTYYSPALIDKSLSKFK
jgi:hypothetical protein